MHISNNARADTVVPAAVVLMLMWGAETHSLGDNVNLTEADIHFGSHSCVD